MNARSFLMVLSKSLYFFLELIQRITHIFYREFKYEQISPVMIQAGNLVEVQVGFCTVQLNRGRFLMLQKLRSICVLSRIVEQVSSKPFISMIPEI